MVLVYCPLSGVVSCNVILIVCDYFVLSIRFDGVGVKYLSG